MGGASSEAYWEHPEGCSSNQPLREGVRGLPVVAGVSPQGRGPFQDTVSVPRDAFLIASSLLLLCFQVTLFVYSDLLLFTKEDEPGRCNVLRNPLYLQSVKLQEGECLQQQLETFGAFSGPLAIKVSGQQQDSTPLSHCFQYVAVPSNWCCQIILPWGAGPASPFPSLH